MLFPLLFSIYRNKILGHNNIGNGVLSKQLQVCGYIHFEGFELLTLHTIHVFPLTRTGRYFILTMLLNSVVFSLRIVFENDLFFVQTLAHDSYSFYCSHDETTADS